MKGQGPIVSFLAFTVTTSWYFVAIGLAVTLCLLALSPFVGMRNMRLTIPVSFSVDPAIIQMTDQNVRVGSEGVAFEVGEDATRGRRPRLHVRGSLRFPTQSRRLVATAAVLMAVLISVVLWVLGHLRAVFRSLRDGQPFVPANATRIRAIAVAVIFGEAARAVVIFLANLYASTHFAAEGLRFDARPDFNIMPIFYGLIILVIAEVFRAGTRLDEDQSLTV